MADEESLEVRCARAWLQQSGVAHRVTCTIKHTQFTSAGFLSFHRKPATEGIGLALDIAGPKPGRDTPELLAVFKALEPLAEEGLLHELILTVAGLSWKDGRKVRPPFAQSGHHDHVHVSLRRAGTFLVPPESLTGPPPIPTFVVDEVLREDAMPIATNAVIGTTPCTVPGCNGWWELQADGAIRTVGNEAHEANHYFGSYLEPWMAEHRNDAARRFTALGPRRGRPGYTCWANDASFYEFGPGIGPVPA